jgi:hypothetical protein
MGWPWRHQIIDNLLRTDLVSEDDTETLEERKLCFNCVGERFLSKEIREQGRRGKCDYCGNLERCYDIETLAERIETAFERHYTRTSTEPDAIQWMMMKDKESDYDWEREGEPVVWAIANAANIPEEAAEDIQHVLADKFASYDDVGCENEFDGDSYYEEKGADAGRWQEDWRNFEAGLKTEARFFSRSAARHLRELFAGIDQMKTRAGRVVVVDAGPETRYSEIYRARVFQSQGHLEEALTRPDRHLGSPPSAAAAAGRMNARGISVFYGANEPGVALAEVRPPVGSRVAVARFEITRPLRLLDLTAVSDVTVEGSIFDARYSDLLERAMFLRNLSTRMVMPVMPDDEQFEYLTTQAVADFLATENDPPLDGIIYPSVQVAKNGLNIVLFHKAACVERMDIPEGSEISASSGDMYEDGWEYDYSVIEKVLPEGPEKKPRSRRTREYRPGCDYDEDFGMGNPTLKIDSASVRVHHVRAVQFETTDYGVRRYRSERHELPF